MASTTVNKTTKNQEQIEKLVKAVTQVKTKLSRLKDVPVDTTNTINRDDIQVKRLAKLNTDRFKDFEKNKTKLDTRQAMEELSAILFTNFEIEDRNLDLVRTYVDELYKRFEALTKMLQVILESNRFLLEQLETREAR